MKFFFFALNVILLLSCKQPTKHGPTSDAQQVKSDWIELINGKDFTGWKASENAETWSIVDNMFQAVGKRSHLFYTGEHLLDSFKNFELEVQVRTFRLANSGIYFHTHYQEAGWPSTGMEIQVNNSHVGEGNYVELKKMASLYGTRNLYKSFGKDSVWMTVKARVESNRVQVWLDGLKTVDYVQPEITKPGVMRLSKGTFCLQGHDSLSKMQYKSFKVRRLPADIKSDIEVPVFGAWCDSFRVYQGKQFAFIDLNPHTDMNASDLAQYVYNTGINASLIKPVTAADFSAATNLPVFTGLRLSVKDLPAFNTTAADYTLATSENMDEAKSILASGKINIWSHRNETLTVKNAPALLDLARKNNVAIEIDNEAMTPSIEVIKLAKTKGCKFSFAGLVPVEKLDNSLYILEVIKAAGLDYRDLYVPKW